MTEQLFKTGRILHKLVLKQQCHQFQAQPKAARPRPISDRVFQQEDQRIAFGLERTQKII